MGTGKGDGVFSPELVSWRPKGGMKDQRSSGYASVHWKDTKVLVPIPPKSIKPIQVAQFNPKYLALIHRNGWHNLIRNIQKLRNVINIFTYLGWGQSVRNTHKKVQIQL